MKNDELRSLIRASYASGPAASSINDLSRQIAAGDGIVATSIAIVEPSRAMRSLLEPPRLGPVPGTSKFPGLSHAEALGLEIEDAVTGKRDRIRQALSRLLTAPLGEGRLELVPRLALGPGAQPGGRYYYPAGHAALRPAPVSGADGGA